MPELYNYMILFKIGQMKMRYKYMQHKQSGADQNKKLI